MLALLPSVSYLVATTICPIALLVILFFLLDSNEIANTHIGRQSSKNWATPPRKHSYLLFHPTPVLRFLQFPLQSSLRELVFVPRSSWSPPQLERSGI